MIDFKLKLILTILASLLFSLIFIMLALVLPTESSKHIQQEREAPQTKFEKMSEGMRQGFKK